MADLKLMLRGGARDGEQLRVEPGQTMTIGRDPSCNYQLLDSRLSRTHFQLTSTKGGLQVEDLDSTNGTFVNGSRITSAHLRAGDTIRVGSTTLTCVAIDATDSHVAIVDEPTDIVETISHRYDSEDADPLSCIAQHKSQAASEKQNAQLRTLISISALLNSALPLPRLFQSIVELVRDIFASDRGCLVVGNAEDGRHYFSYAPNSPRTGWRLSRTVLHQALDEGLSVMTSDASQDARFQARESVMVQAIKSVICAPLQCGNEVLGAIYLDTTTQIRAFAREDLDLLSAIGKQAGMALKRELVKEEKELLFLDTIRAVIAAIEAKDAYTAGHSARVGDYGATLAASLGYNDYFVDRLRYAANLHDVGKIGIPEHILNKPGKLTHAEYLIIKTHPDIGARILENIRHIEDVIEGVRHHHERMDGSGYPSGLAGENIPLISRFIAVADSFDAMTSDRSYRQALTVAEAIARFRDGMGTQFDPSLIEPMIALLKSEAIVPIRTKLKVF